MNGWMKEEVQEQTEHGLAGDVEITARKRRGRMEGGQTDWVDEEKKGEECLGDMRDSLAVRRGMMMGDRNHSSGSPTLSTHVHTSH